MPAVTSIVGGAATGRRSVIIIVQGIYRTRSKQYYTGVEMVTYMITLLIGESRCSTEGGCPGTDVAEESHCHHHGRLARLSLNSFFILLSPTLLIHSLILSPLLILSVHVTLILSYPYIFTFTLIHSLSFSQMRWIFYDDIQERKGQLSTRSLEGDPPQPTRKQPGS